MILITQTKDGKNNFMISFKALIDYLADAHDKSNE